MRYGSTDLLAETRCLFAPIPCTGGSLQDGRSFWRGPCGVKYAFPERPDLPCNGQVLFNGETRLQAAPRGL